MMPSTKVLMRQGEQLIFGHGDGLSRADGDRPRNEQEATEETEDDSSSVSSVASCAEFTKGTAGREQSKTEGEEVCALRFAV
jgi:hypothetical protein